MLSMLDPSLTKEYTHILRANMVALGALTEEQKSKAFQKALGIVQLDMGKLARVTEEQYENVVDFIRDNYLPDEPVHRAAGAKWGKDAREMHMEAICQNISVMIISEKDGEIMALLTNQVVQNGEIHGQGEMEDAGLIRVWKYVATCENKAKLFEHFKVDEAVQLVSLVTNRKYRQWGLGTKVVQASLAMIRNFGVGKVCVKGEGSSLYTQKIFEGEGMGCLYTGVYAEYEEDGKKVLEETGIHDSIKMYGMIVDSQ